MSYRVPASPLARLAPRSSIWRRLGAVVQRGLLLRLERRRWRGLPAVDALGKLCCGSMLDSAVLQLFRKPRCCGQLMVASARDCPEPLFRCVVNRWHTADGLQQAYAMEAVQCALRAAGVAQVGEPQLQDGFEIAYVPTAHAERVIGELWVKHGTARGWSSVRGLWLDSVHPPRCAQCATALAIALRTLAHQEGLARHLLPGRSLGDRVWVYSRS